jgi:putative bacteriocin precursor
MKELIKPSNYISQSVIAFLCEIDCECAHVQCNKNCWGGTAGPNSSTNQDEDILF